MSKVGFLERELDTLLYKYSDLSYQELADVLNYYATECLLRAKMEK